jgi:hypothetical protein
MDRVRPVVRVLFSYAAASLVGTMAWQLLVISVTPGTLRDYAMVAVALSMSIGGTVVAWRWLGQPLAVGARSALTRLIKDGRNLRRRLKEAVEVGASDADQVAWKVRVNDWSAEAERVVGEVASVRLPAYLTDAIYADTGRDVPKWASGLFLDLDVRIERLVLIRASL